MSDNFPDGWISGAEKQASEKEYGMTNDHGILYLVGDVRDGEYLQTMEKLPPRLQNRR